jgi:hypothetical protein
MNDEALPALIEMTWKMQELERLINEELQVEGTQLAQVVTEHVLACIHRWDPSSSLEPVVWARAGNQGSDKGKCA